MSQRENATEPPRRDHRQRWVALGAGAGVVVVAVALGIAAAAAGGSEPAAAGATAPTTSSSAAPTTSAAPVTTTPAPETTPTVDADPAALADLDAVAATLTDPIVLTTPAGWDQWLPADKPYPGVDTADDMSTCPKLSDRLGAALDHTMSYWTGTLPGGGCTWATVPLYAGPNAPNYPYVASVSFLSDGRTTEQTAAAFYHHQGRLCPYVTVPSAGRGVYLTRCEELDGISYVLVLPDTRTSGVWVLSGQARSDAAHPATDVLRPVIEGTVATFG
jgi:hypothetical protein